MRAYSSLRSMQEQEAQAYLEDFSKKHLAPAEDANKIIERTRRWLDERLASTSADRAPPEPD